MVVPPLAGGSYAKGKEGKPPGRGEEKLMITNRTEEDTKKPRLKKKKKYQIAVNLSNCKYDIVREVIRKKGWIEVDEEADWQLCWTDTSVGLERLLRLNKTQKINHFSGMLEICRKKSLCRNIANMSKKSSQEYNFVPRSFMLPEGLDDLLSYLNTKNRKGKKPTTFILKPDNGCQGKGIRLLQTAKDVHNAVEYCENQKAVVQHYIPKPFLINDLKFDLRVYALVTCCDPLRIFLYNEGLVRFCTEKYQAPRQDNLNIACMHLTNYAVNKHNVNFEADNSTSDSLEGSKWSLKSLKEWMEANGHDWEKVWEDIGDMTVKTVISVQPILSYFYQSAFPIDNDGLSCFEILGLDVMLDHKCKPWLIEVNHSPSFNTDTELDLDVKEGLISDTINLIQLSASRIKKAKAEDKRACKERLYSSRSYSARKITREEAQKKRKEAICSSEKYESKYKGRFMRVFPVPDEPKQDKYNTLLDMANQNFKESFHFKIETTLEKFKLSAMEKNAARDAKEAAKDLARKKKSRRKSTNLTGRTLSKLQGGLQNPRHLRGNRQMAPSNAELDAKREEEKLKQMLASIPPGLVAESGVLLSDGKEYLDVVQRKGRSDAFRNAIRYSNHHSRSNSFSDRKDFPQFRDIPANALYKSLGYPQTPTYSENGDMSGEPQYNGTKQHRRNENLIYKDDLLRYRNNELRLQQEAGSLMNLSISGTRI
ncbi:Tubulin-tyrosine ligase/tubulin polyglutamylase [Chloropicon primus]|uniref:Tubulin-tyrosine ligase/tubulin polyglutamylase n=1 Tax=Chloropicon primus TaxID=1764295 RepID=A0A5B8MLR0_9CHLO|nr:Tubulin-tyrosine ligase/tubulin polyglutamylase [Chloropicon primus]UPR00584.1 Tubulin-tyrosine ligase/tubulin polyglutamylase [Chloropicon primus]|eukprot:QDZ21369.1 Tubulin-tyrosine ligase/tubulin polyglutamylase [Chloropicon primus]